MILAVLPERPASPERAAQPPTSSSYEELPVAVLLCAPSGSLTYANPRAAKLFGLTQAAFLGRDVSDLLAPLDTLRTLAKRSGAVGRCELTLGRRKLPIEYEVNNTASEQLLICLRDRSEKATLRSERDRLLRMALVSEMLPTVLHELRNPLAAVTSAVENLVEDAEEDEGLQPQRSLLNAILHELRRMGLTFQGMGSVGRGLRSTRAEAIDIAIEETCRIMSGRAERNRIALSCNAVGIPPLPLEPGVLRAIVFNLLNNALQACRPGDAVNVSGHFERGLLTISVRDTGRGMTPEVLKQALNPFFTTRSDGSGLGLVICREAIEEAGGQLTIDSSLGLGTTVTVRVPMSERNPNQQGAH